MSEHFDGSILFVDASGFSALAENLSARGNKGIEELCDILTKYFTELIEIIEDEEGDIVQFAG